MKTVTSLLLLAVACVAQPTPKPKVCLVVDNTSIRLFDYKIVDVQAHNACDTATPTYFVVLHIINEERQRIDAMTVTIDEMSPKQKIKQAFLLPKNTLSTDKPWDAVVFKIYKY